MNGSGSFTASGAASALSRRFPFFCLRSPGPSASSVACAIAAWTLRSDSLPAARTALLAFGFPRLPDRICPFRGPAVAPFPPLAGRAVRFAIVTGRASRPGRHAPWFHDEPFPADPGGEWTTNRPAGSEDPAHTRAPESRPPGGPRRTARGARHGTPGTSRSRAPSPRSARRSGARTRLPADRAGGRGDELPVGDGLLERGALRRIDPVTERSVNDDGHVRHLGALPGTDVLPGQAVRGWGSNVLRSQCSSRRRRHSWAA